MKRKDTNRAAVILTAATLATLIVIPATGSAANLSGSSFAVKAVNKEEAAKHFAIRPLFSGTPAPTAPPTTAPTTPPTTTPPTTTPTAPPTTAPGPTPTSEFDFAWAIESDGSARVQSLRPGYLVTDIVIPETVSLAVSSGGTVTPGSGTPRTVTAIDNQAFAGKGLTSVIIPDSVRKIGAYAFDNNKLTSIKLPSSLTAIDASVFSNNLLTSVTISDQIKTIGNNAFYKNKITSLSIGKSVTTMGIFAFQYNNLSSLVLPDSVTAIGAYGFANNQLTSVGIPPKLTALKASVFRANRLTSVTIPSGITTIEESAFRENTSLKTVYMEGNAPTTFVAADTTGSFDLAAGKTVYYKSGATGFTSPTWKGYATATY